MCTWITWITPTYAGPSLPSSTRAPAAVGTRGREPRAPGSGRVPGLWVPDSRKKHPPYNGLFRVQIRCVESQVGGPVAGAAGGAEASSPLLHSLWLREGAVRAGGVMWPCPQDHIAMKAQLTTIMAASWMVRCRSSVVRSGIWGSWRGLSQAARGSEKKNIAFRGG
jgi:hypothetical protein